MSTQVNIEEPATVVVIDQENVDVTVQENAFSVVLAELGVQGAQGPQGPQGPAGANGIDRNTYVHNQNVPSAVWSIAHNLGSYPSVTVIDSAGTTVVGDVTYVSANAITITFSGSFSGQAFLN
jgi:hypothetical protein